MKVRVTAAFTDLDSLRGESWSAIERPEYPSWEACESAPQKGVEFRQRVELRLVSGHEVFSERRANGSGEFRGWVRHRDGSDPDSIGLLMFADAAPPPVRAGGLGADRGIDGAGARQTCTGTIAAEPDLARAHARRGRRRWPVLGQRRHAGCTQSADRKVSPAALRPCLSFGWASGWGCPGRQVMM